MVVVKRQSYNQQRCSAPSELPMGNVDFSSVSYEYSDSRYTQSRDSYRKENATTVLDSIPSWMVPVVYFMAIISWISACQRYGNHTKTFTNLDLKMESLAVNQEESRNVLNDATQSLFSLKRHFAKVKNTSRLLEHEVRMYNELLETNGNNNNDEKKKQLDPLKKSGIMRRYEGQRQDMLGSKIQHLKQCIQNESKKQVIEKYGPGPHRVKFELEFPNEEKRSRKNGKFIIEMASINILPHSVETFLDMVSSGIWDNTVFSYHSSSHHVIAAAPMVYGSYEPKHLHFAALGFNGVGFPEYSSEFPHEEYTLGFSGKGPNFYINAIDNTKQHGPGGQGHHDMADEADPCFGKVISGKNYIKQILDGPSDDKDPSSSPTTWRNYQLTRIVKLKVI